jgi:hypothetical protein
MIIIGEEIRILIEVILMSWLSSEETKEKHQKNPAILPKFSEHVTLEQGIHVLTQTLSSSYSC